MADHPDYAGFNRLRGDETHNPLGTLAILLPGEGTATYGRQLHVLQAGDRELDLNIAAQTHPTLYIHSTTTPITDYLRLTHDGTTGFIDVAGGTIMAFQIDGTSRLAMTATLLSFDGGNLVIDQAALDTNALSLRSSDVSHGMTTLNLGQDVNGDDFFVVSKLAAATGGAHITAIDESAAVGMHIEAWAGAGATTDTLSSLAVMNFFVGEHNGSNADVDMAANTNAFAWGEIDSSGVRQTRMLLKADDGEMHIDDVTLVDLADDADDVMVLRGLRRHRDPNGAVESPWEVSNPYRDYDKLRELQLVGPRNEHGEFLYPLQRRIAFHEDTMWQLFTDMMDIAQALPEEARGKLGDRMQRRLSFVSGG